MVDSKDLDIVHLAPDERPLSSTALARLKDSIQDELQRQMQKSDGPPRAAAIGQALVNVFGTHRSMRERQLFYLFAAPIVRKILLQKARVAGRARGLDVQALDASLHRLEALAPRHLQMIDLYFFSGLTLRETADLLGQPEGALTRDIRFVKAWLANTSGL